MSPSTTKISTKDTLKYKTMTNKKHMKACREEYEE
jgi:hypothetical protein